jgi:hypothetical protein
MMTVYKSKDFSQTNVPELIKGDHKTDLFDLLKDLVSSVYSLVRGPIAIFLIILLFLGANTTFLVYEQMTFYLLKGYSNCESVCFSLLPEAALLLLSVMISNSESRIQKLLLYGLLGSSLFVVALTIKAGVERKNTVEMEMNSLADYLDGKIKDLKEIKKVQVAEFQVLDPLHFKMRKDLLLKKIEAGDRELSEAVSKRLAVHKVDHAKEERDILVWMRYLALLWNVAIGFGLGQRVRSL